MYIPRLGTADLHIHTSASDGVAHVHELLNFITHHRPMLDVIAITDHDTLDASLWAYEGRHQYPFDIVPGVEVSSRGGHVLALWVTTLIPRDMSLPETVAAIHEAGGVAILAHPFHVEIDVSRHNARRHWQHPSVLLDCGLDAIESYNAGVVTPGSNWLAGYFARKIGLTVTGSSDAHTLGAVGTGVTRFTGHTSVHLRAAFAEQRTRAEGRTWPIIEYVNYLRHATQRKAQTSMASTT